MRVWHFVVACLLLACGHQDGIVGVLPLAAGGEDAGGSATAGFLEEFAQPNDRWEPQTELPGATASVGEMAANARDGYLAELRLPGHPEYTASSQVGAGHATQLATLAPFHFGTYRTRLSFSACAANEEAVLAFLGYFNDGQDHDGDGIVDDVEINIQVTCSNLNRLYLTVFTDFEESPQGTRFRKLSRVVDFTTGDSFETLATDSDEYGPAGNDPHLLQPEMLTPDVLYELGFEWHTDSIRFFALLDGVERDLWTLTGAERVPQEPVQILYNLWHPATHWYPSEGPADFPARDVLMRVDWASFEPQ